MDFNASARVSPSSRRPLPRTHLRLPETPVASSRQNAPGLEQKLEGGYERQDGNRATEPGPAQSRFEIDIPGAEQRQLSPQARAFLDVGCHGAGAREAAWVHV